MWSYCSDSSWRRTTVSECAVTIRETNEEIETRTSLLCRLDVAFWWHNSMRVPVALLWLTTPSQISAFYHVKRLESRNLCLICLFPCRLLHSARLECAVSYESLKWVARAKAQRGPKCIAFACQMLPPLSIVPVALENFSILVSWASRQNFLTTLEWELKLFIYRSVRGRVVETKTRSKTALAACVNMKKFTAECVVLCREIISRIHRTNDTWLLESFTLFETRRAPETAKFPANAQSHILRMVSGAKVLTKLFVLSATSSLPHWIMTTTIL